MIKSTIVFLLLSIILFACSPRERTPLPPHILDMKLHETVTGASAREIINHLHMKNVVPEENFIGRYAGTEHHATYYLSMYHDSASANEALSEMLQAMQGGGHVFDHIRKLRIGERDIYMALGMGQAHYFFTRDDQLIWTAIDIPIAEKAISSLVE